MLGFKSNNVKVFYLLNKKGETLFSREPAWLERDGDACRDGSCCVPSTADPARPHVAVACFAFGIRDRAGPRWDFGEEVEWFSTHLEVICLGRRRAIVTGP